MANTPFSYRGAILRPIYDDCLYDLYEVVGTAPTGEEYTFRVYITEPDAVENIKRVVDERLDGFAQKHAQAAQAKAQAAQRRKRAKSAGVGPRPKRPAKPKLPAIPGQVCEPYGDYHNTVTVKHVVRKDAYDLWTNVDNVRVQCGGTRVGRRDANWLSLWDDALKQEWDSTVGQIDTLVQHVKVLAGDLRVVVTDKATPEEITVTVCYGDDPDRSTGTVTVPLQLVCDGKSFQWSLNGQPVGTAEVDAISTEVGKQIATANGYVTFPEDFHLPYVIAPYGYGSDTLLATSQAVADSLVKAVERYEQLSAQQDSIQERARKAWDTFIGAHLTDLHNYQIALEDYEEAVAEWESQQP